MNTVHTLWLGLVSILLISCASQGRYDLDMSITEMSEAIESSAEAIVELDARPERGPSIETSAFFYSNGYSDFDGFANNRVLIARRQSVNVGINNYDLGSGYELAFIGGDDVHQVRVAVYVNDAQFKVGSTEGFNSPMFLGFDVGFHAIRDMDPVEFFAGIRFTSAILGYEFDSPVSILGEVFTSDSLGAFGVGVPLGMHVALGNFSMEAVAAPMLYLHAAETSLGARNDLVTWNSNIPISIGLGYNW
jgi:hypothetical protein